MSHGKQSAGPVTAADVRAVRFPLVRRGGYDPKQVDPFLEVVAQTLEGGPLADPTMNADYIQSVRFGTVRRSGYEATKVDAFLDRVIDTLEPLDGQRPLPVPAVASAVGGPADEPGSDAAAAGADVAPVPATETGASTDAATPATPEPAGAPLEPAASSHSRQDTAVVSAAPAPPSPAEEGQAHLDRLRALYEAGLLSDKEVKVLSQRVKRWTRERIELAEAAGAASGKVDANSVA